MLSLHFGKQQLTREHQDTQKQNGTPCLVAELEQTYCAVSKMTVLLGKRAIVILFVSRTRLRLPTLNACDKEFTVDIHAFLNCDIFRSCRRKPTLTKKFAKGLKQCLFSQ